MKILITGATGLVGTELTRLCEQQGIEVNYLTTSKQKLIKREGYNGYLWNPDKGEIDLEAFKGVESIINLAGATVSKRWTPSYKKKIRSSRLDTLNTLRTGLSQADTSGITSLVSASAIGIYKNSLTNFYTEDSTEISDDFLGDVVQDWEKAVDQIDGLGFKTAKVRIGLVLSMEGGALSEMVRPINYYAGAAFGSGQQWQSWIHIQDLARLLFFVATEGLEGTFNAVAPNPVTNTKLTREIARVLRKPLILPNIPRFAMRLLLGEMSELLFASQRVSSKKIEQSGFVFEYPNIGRALEKLLAKGTEEDSRKGQFTEEYV
ncbi:TIGR01777 family oxidoreductase [Poritiphilus flavus]|uniref:TIGR01777 family protein n=1 Tax=Poritiphilus flavus TaxID=2697053 RepID=A0A6L9E9N4_9FLAO|nr:TIGR01777 family oxidoreductase [Poritiphilus flavus]NAS11199.1 TIGR01777 family protein [Poritiphilus flavus]